MAIPKADNWKDAVNWAWRESIESTHTIANGDISTATDASAAPTSGEKLVVLAFTISTSAAAEVTIKEETSGTTLFGPYYMPANGTLQIFPPRKKLPTADKKVQAQSSTSDNATVETWTISEA